jgi:predicted DNA-binding transcriptional regulator AlpA
MTGKPKTGPWRRKLTTRLLCDRYGISDRTVDRWVASGILPRQMVINRRKFWDEDELEQRDQERMATAEGSGAAA